MTVLPLYYGKMNQSYTNDDGSYVTYPVHRYQLKCPGEFGTPRSLCLSTLRIPQQFSRDKAMLRSWLCPVYAFLSFIWCVCVIILVPVGTVIEALEIFLLGPFCGVRFTPGEEWIYLHVSDPESISIIDKDTPCLCIYNCCLVTRDYTDAELLAAAVHDETAATNEPGTSPAVVEANKMVREDDAETELDLVERGGQDFPSSNVNTIKS